MNVIPTQIEGCIRIRPTIHKDLRGWFYESYNQREFNSIIAEEISFVQDNRSYSGKHVLRGLHYQKEPYSQAKLIQVINGRVRDIIVDIRKDSPTYLQILSLELSADIPEMVYIPKGLAHGFLSLEKDTVFQYKCSSFYSPESEAGIRFDDPDLNLDWGIPHKQIILSEKDKNLPFLKTILG